MPVTLCAKWMFALKREDSSHKCATPQNNATKTSPHKRPCCFTAALTFDEETREKNATLRRDQRRFPPPVTNGLFHSHRVTPQASCQLRGPELPEIVTGLRRVHADHRVWTSLLLFVSAVTSEHGLYVWARTGSVQAWSSTSTPHVDK